MRFTGFLRKDFEIILQIEAGGGKRGKAREGGKEGGRPIRPPLLPPSQSPKGAWVATDNANARAALSALMVATTSAAK